MHLFNTREEENARTLIFRVELEERRVNVFSLTETQRTGKKEEKGKGWKTISLYPIFASLNIFFFVIFFFN